MDQNADQDQMMLDYLMEIGAMAPQQETIARQRQLADRLRGAGARAPEMRQTGRLAKAASPLEFLSSGLNTWAGQREDAGANTKQDEYDAKRRAALTDLRNKMQPQVSPRSTTLPGADDYWM